MRAHVRHFYLRSIDYQAVVQSNAFCYSFTTMFFPKIHALAFAVCAVAGPIDSVKRHDAGFSRHLITVSSLTFTTISVTLRALLTRS